MSIKPGNGYMLTSFIVNGEEKINEIEDTFQESLYLFLMPARFVTISAVFQRYVFSHFEWSEDGKSAFAVFIDSDGAVVVGINADIAESIATHATCEEKGVTEYIATVTFCGNEYTATTTREDILPLGHDIVVDEAVAATCTEAGLTEGRHCTRCGEILIEQLDIPALGHEWDEWITNTDAGVRSHTCVRCGEEETVIIPIIEIPSFAKHSLVLSGEIGVRFRVSFPEEFDFDGCSMDFATTNRSETINYANSEAISGSTDRYFTFYINALELADTINATLNYGDGETITDKYSAMDYIQTAPEFYPDDEALLDLVNALHGYGYYMQGSGWTDGYEHAAIPAVEMADSISVAKNAVKDYAVVKTIGKDSGIADVKYSLTLNEQTIISAYFKPEESITISSSTGKKSGTLQIDGETYYKFNTDKINVGNLGTDYTISVTTSTGGTASVKASAMSYVNTILTSTSSSDGQKAAMAAYYYYYKAANDYQISHSK